MTKAELDLIRERQAHAADLVSRYQLPLSMISVSERN